MNATDDIDIEIPSVCQSVTLRYCVKTAKRYKRFVEVISLPNSPVIIAFGQLIAVTKFGRRSPLIGPEIL